ncbi:hypothetical protein GA0070610_0345 [Micromonospora echinofusca]|uniref:Uncharacterized protein n=1 Tax=Micromonospora echinofusca TaxID=47858 RepID=A0A1C5G371_MICEH|nr:hypothetical protein [Micromonospora echinofusca]SCG14148.1 hypothetical protein GA0070610_0345 [Micromonospora echinofusca]
MAFRTWGRLLLTALGVSLLAGAGQLGIAFGFGVVRLTGTFTGTTVNQWPAQLVWAGWFAANAAVVGAVLTERLARRDGGLAGTGRLLAVAGAAALGATVVAPLCMQPARAAELVSVDPVWAVGICAVLGAVAGAGAALAVLLQPPVGWNMAAVAGAVWLLALISVTPSLLSTGPLGTVRLGVLEPASLDAGAAQRLALVVLPLVALLAGAATGGLARWRGHPPLVSGATGVAGPVLVAFAYLTAGPGDTADRYQLTPYYAALLAVAAGALGSAAAALLRWPLVARTAPTGAIEPTDILRPLPAGPALPHAPASAAGDEPETVDLAGATLATTDRAGGTDSGAVTTATGDGREPRTVPPHWDWPAEGGIAPAPAARTGAGPQRTAGSDAPAAADRPVAPEPARTPDAAAHAPTAPSVPATAEATPVAEASPDFEAPSVLTASTAAEATPAGQPLREATLAGRPARETTPPVQPAEAPTPAAQPAEGTSAAQPPEGATPAGQPAEGSTPAGQPATASAPKPRRTRKPRSTRQVAPAAASEAADPTPTAEAPTPVTGDPTSAAPEPTPTAAEPTPTAADPKPGDADPTPAAPDAPAIADTAANSTTVPAAGAAPPPVPAWPVPPRPQADTADVARPATEPAAESTPRPRHRAPMPDLARAASWEALATARRGGPAPVSADSTPTNGGTATGAEASPGSASPGEAEQPTGRGRGRLALFRRNRSRAEEAPAGQEPEPLPAQDEEYVDWVTGLSRAVPDNEPEQENGRRSLRSTGRHHRD